MRGSNLPKSLKRGRQFVDSGSEKRYKRKANDNTLSQGAGTVSFVSSSIGRKMIMGVCGAIWAGFVLTHMAANTLILFSAELYNKYSHAIVSNKPLLYGAEAVLLLALIVHATLGIKLALENRAARQKKYAVGTPASKRTTIASRTMAIQGSLILAFVIYHLITFKYGTHYDVTYDGVVMRDLHRLVLEVFQSPAYVAWYIFCLILLGFHLSHGAWSVFQSLGINHPKYNPYLKVGSVVYAVVVALGFMAAPIYVMTMA